jgi:D-amino-acid dehydrogenase
MSTAGKRAIVVGGGVIGAACAYYLNHSGWEVSIVDQDAFGRGCSHANCGYVCPSHVLPLAVPGAVRAGLKALLQPNGPFTIRPRLDPALWSWLWRFARRCNHRDMLAAGQAIQALLTSSRRLYEKVLSEEAIDCEWQSRGLLFVFHSPKAMDHYAETDRLLRETFHTPARRFDGAALTELEPALKPGLAGGWLYETDAHLRPDKLMSGWRRVLETRGVVIREHCGVTRVIRAGEKAGAVVTRQGELPADAFVFSTGAWTPLLNRELGCRIPIQPGKGYSITMPRPARCPVLPMIFEEHRVGVTPFQSGYRLGSTMEFAGYDTSLNRKRLALLREGARHYLHEPYCDPVEEEWFGWRPMTPDSLPIIDRSPVMSNVIIAAGHNMLGLSMAPATGKLVAELLDEERPHVKPGPYAVSRFA